MRITSGPLAERMADAAETYLGMAPDDVLHGFRLEAGMYTGPVFGVVTEAIRPTDTAGDLPERLADSGARLLVATLDGGGTHRSHSFSVLADPAMIRKAVTVLAALPTEREVTITLQARVPRWTAAATRHIIENNGTTEAVAILVELK